ncbi:hypothetical protein SCUCBS95973_006193 [Sporothrix curviconia]|uniref:Zn(2)-C6 fungal-type domain-containing protein n=1 Tax=Sporothrix curviconia TaxID=1260050 RepID=A0ABP0C3E8_9PEZI
MAPPFEDMTNTFVFSAAPSTNRAVLAEVPKGLHNPSRQRQSHRKSRAGCDNCKRRRVKCNEEVPCAGCRRRREVCERPGHRLQPAVPKPMDTVAPPTATSLTAPTRNTGDSVVNLLHLKLLHHFQVHTCQTLVFSADVWATALQLSFQFEFLSNAVLCVAARHLAFLHMDSADASSVSRGAGPDAASYAATAATHLCRALAGFRRELMTKDFSTATDLDAFIITSTLLQFELWSSTDFLPSGRRGLDLERDRLFTFSASLKLVFLKSVPEALRQQPDSVFMPHDLDAFFLLYHFYRTIRQLLPQESCWWAHGRTAVMEGALYDWLQTA